MSRTSILFLLALSLIGCSQTGSPLSPGSEPLLPDIDPAATPAYDPIDELFREGAGLVDGEVTLNGSTEFDPNFDASPYIITQPAKAGDIAIFRVRGRLTTNAATTLYTKQSSPSKNYSSFTVPGTNLDQYKAMYITNTEPLSITLYNATSYNTPLNGPAAIYNYSFKTQARENGGEPNDDDNGATIADRSLANNLPIGFLASRSVYQLDAVTKDVEEWYKATVTAGETFSFQFSTIAARFGTWSYTLKVLDPGGTQMGDPVVVAAGAATASITRTAAETGTYYLQMVGTPVTKNNTNLYYNLYTLTACLQPRINELDFQPAIGACPGTARTWSASVSNSAASFAWDFGGGCTPNTSSSAAPVVTLGAAGNYTATLQVTGSCGVAQIELPYSVSCPGWVGTQGGGVVTAERVEVDAQGNTRMLGQFSGSVDLDPSAGVFAASSAEDRLFLTILDRQGALDEVITIGGVGAGHTINPTCFSYNATEGYRIAGTYSGTVDFDPSWTSTSRTAATQGSNFLLALDPALAFRWVRTFGTGGSITGVSFMPTPGQAAIVGNFSDTVDLDPGISVYSRTSAGSTDAYTVLYDTSGTFVSGGAWGGPLADVTNGIFVNNFGSSIVGYFAGTADFNPHLTGSFPKTSAGGQAAYVIHLSPLSFPFLLGVDEFTGASATVNAVDVVQQADGSEYILGTLAGTADFDAGPGTQSRFSQGGTDVFVVGLHPNFDFAWVTMLGGAANDTGTAMAMIPATGELRVVGTWDGTVDFDPGAGVDLRAAVGGPDAFLLGLTGGGTRLFASTWSGAGEERPWDIAMEPLGNVRVVGDFTQTPDFDPGGGVLNITATGSRDSFIQSFTPIGTW